ncbi:MAG: Mur ligase family protein [Methanobrevibacter sp.]|uniref:TFIIB-type zinc ribbon-containing protein n=1 Tax=Methanobrevibacter sp. TaxID=66852 RepID=UPI0026E078CC|nr:Mur ligase family protein [Methanobrevibacter sp.]MDO5849333.1 Mur ligase family protein [Methanobrevibacter sp.]
MVSKLRYNLAKIAGKAAIHAVKLGSGAGMSFPGSLFLKIGGQEALKSLSDEVDIGSILITGTNGKTTTTTLLIKLLSKDLDIRRSYESNTISAIATGLLKGDGDIGIFEYGIRDIKHGIPDTIQRLVNPIGVVYTTISREHSQVAGIKNPFDQYLKAKTLLSQEMGEGVIITNADDPRTANIGLNKSNDIKVNYYGVASDKILDIFEDEIVECPNCGTSLEYSHRFMNHRGEYKCPDCGLERPKLNVYLKDIEFGDKWTLDIVGNLFNYSVNKDISFNVKITVPPFGLHNVYNTLASITAYATFTPTPEKIESTIGEIFNNLDMSFIPPGRFEVVDVNGKKVGLGQGDNGDAAKINALFMNQYIEGPLEFIYTTPDVNEEEIFEDHLKSIRALDPAHLIVVPGRESVEIAEKYYNQIKDEFNSDFYPLSYENMPERIDKLCELATNSDYDYVIMTGCGEEQAMWENIKQKLIK